MKKKKIHVYAFKLHSGAANLFCSSLSAKITEKLEEWMKILHEGCDAQPIDGSQTEYAQLNRVVKEDGMYYIGFAKLDMVDGPAKGNIRGELEAFKLNDDEGFARMSSALYDPKTNAFIVETSLSSLSAERMLNYIYDVENDNTGMRVRLTPIIVPDVYDKIDSGHKEMRRIEIAINPQSLPEECYKNNKSLKSLIQSARSGSFDGTISVVLQARGSSIIPDSIRKTFRPLWRFITSNSNEHDKTVSKCKVRIKNPNEVGVEALDLINARVCKDVEVNVGRDRMVLYDVRFNALLNAYNEWKDRFFEEE